MQMLGSHWAAGPDCSCDVALLSTLVSSAALCVSPLLHAEACHLVPTSASGKSTSKARRFSWIELVMFPPDLRHPAPPGPCYSGAPSRNGPFKCRSQEKGSDARWTHTAEVTRWVKQGRPGEGGRQLRVHPPGLHSVPTQTSGLKTCLHLEQGNWASGLAKATL